MKFALQYANDSWYQRRTVGMIHVVPRRTLEQTLNFPLAAASSIVVLDAGADCVEGMLYVVKHLGHSHQPQKYTAAPG